MDGWNTSVCFCDFILSSRANLLLVSRVSVCWDDFCLAQLMHVAGLSWVLSLVRRDDIKHIPTTSHLHFWTGILGQLISDILVIISTIFCKCSSFLGVRNKIWQTSKKDAGWLSMCRFGCLKLQVWPNNWEVRRTLRFEKSRSFTIHVSRF